MAVWRAIFEASATYGRNLPATSSRRYRALSDRLIDADVAFMDAPEYTGPAMYWDTKVPGLRVHVGRRQVSFSYFKQNQVHGNRKTTSITLGFWPAMKVAGARKAALVQAGRVASGRILPGQRSGTKVSEAIERYLEHLRKGKAGSRWPVNAESLARRHILPAFGNFLLHELSASPGMVEDWHSKIAKASPAAADHAARILRAMYRREARRDRTLPPGLPTSAVEFKPIVRSQKAMGAKDWRAWAKAWAKIEAPSRRAFQMVNLLTGCRPGELARLKWEDVKPSERVFVIGGVKAGDDIRVVMSRPIVKALLLARSAAIEGNPYVFPARDGGHIVKFDVDGLPAHGMMLRRTWRTVAADIGVDELMSHFLLGHRPAGISRGYIAKMILAAGQGMRTAQRRISNEMMKRLGLSTSTLAD